VVETFFGEFAKAVDLAQEAADIWQTQFRIAQNDANCRTRLLQAWVSLAAFQICSREFRAAVGTALRGLELEPKRVDLEAMLVLSYCLTDQIDMAKVIVRKNNDLGVGNNLKFLEVVLDDLYLLHDKGLTNLDVKSFEKLLTTD
jgi:hypothetical protein